MAAQNPADPGVLVLSEFAGAAKELDAALLVNPHDIDGMAQRISRALVMPAEERRERWLAMIGKLRSASALSGFSDFVRALDGVRGATQPIPARRQSALAFSADLMGRSSIAQTH